MDEKKDIELKLTIKELEKLVYIVRDEQRFQHIGEEEILAELERQLMNHKGKELSERALRG